MEPTGLARLALMPLERMTRAGLPRAEMLREARLDEAQLRDPDARIPLAAVSRLWRAVTRHVPDPTVGLRFGAETRVRELGLVGYTMAFSSTLGAALTRLARYGRIVSDALTVTLDADADATTLRLEVQAALRAFRPAVDARLAAVVAVCREITGAPIAPQSVHVPYRRPADLREYEKFFRAPLEFGTLASALVLASEDLARPVALSDDTLTGYLEHLADQTLAALGAERTVADRVRRVLWSELSEGVPTLERVAGVLGTSARTLQRQLRAEGLTFASVLMQFRHDMALPLLRDGQLAVSEVAFLLGYEDPSSFQRAFRRWRGVSPRAFRQTLA